MWDFHTAQLAQPSSKLIALLQHALAALFDKRVKFGCEGVHALAQVFEIEVDARELSERVVGVGRGRRQHRRCVLGCAER